MNRLLIPIHLIFCTVSLAQVQTHEVRALKITVLSTMLADLTGVGEWGFSALVEADGRKFLFDTGTRPETVIENARELGLDLSGIPEVILTHNHWDHVGGLLTLRRELSKKNPAALSRAHVSEGIFLERPAKEARNMNGLLPLKASYEAMGGSFVVHGAPVELAPGIWFTGPVPRTHPERNYPRGGMLRVKGDLIEDTIPEDASLVIRTTSGLVLLSGCGHAGIVNTAEYARTIGGPAPLHAAIGGFHLLQASDSALTWTAGKLRGIGVQYLLPAHCTGIEASYRLRQLCGLTRETAVVGAVGSSFTLGKGIDPLLLAR